VTSIMGVKPVVILVLFLALLPITASAETPVESNIDSRLILGFHVSDSELQNWVPAPWQVSPVPAGPTKGVNLFMLFIQNLLSQTPDGKPSASGGTARHVTLVIPARHAPTGEESSIVMRVYTTDHGGLPGPYRNSVKAEVRRELTLRGENLAPGTGSDYWEMREASGGGIVVRITYQRTVPSRVKVERKVRSSVEPDFYRIYRLDQGTENVKSVPEGIDRLQSYEFSSTVPELSKLFDGGSQLVSITAVPWYIQQVSLP